jgi:glyoxylase-like metal-dependent hydrolase (beta-lactamase superfamily II)
MVVGMATSTSLEQPIEGLWAMPGSPLPFDSSVSVRAFLLEREEGNVIVYNAPGLASVADQIRQRGETTRLLINHGHEGMFGPPPIDTPVFVHERDRAELGGSIPVAGTFSGREMIGEDIEAIPIPGHTPGSTAYLWDGGVHRFLFTGDSVWLDHGEWSAVVLDPGGRQDYLDSLALMRDLDFDVLVPWGATQDDPYVAAVSRSEAQERLEAIIQRVEAGGDR